jgi:hypothetical protein
MIFNAYRGSLKMSSLAYEYFKFKQSLITTEESESIGNESKINFIGLNRDLNPGPLAPKARIIPLDH